MKTKKKTFNYSLPENVMDFYISEEMATYDGNNGKKQFAVVAAISLDRRYSGILMKHSLKNVIRENVNL